MYPTLNTGSGDDIVSINGTYSGYGLGIPKGSSVANSKVLLGDGDDYVYLAGNVTAGLPTKFADTGIYGGTGNDTLTFTGSGVTQDMQYVKGFETIDLTGSGNNTLTNVTLENVQANADSGTLHIKGDAFDKVELNANGWNNVGSTLEDGVSYNIYRHSSMTTDENDILVQSGIIIG